MYGTGGEGRRLNRTLRASAFVATGLLLVLVGCVTVPPPQEPYPDRYLAADQSAYFAINVEDNRDLFASILEGLEIDAESAIGRVDQLVGSFASPGDVGMSNNVAAREGTIASETRGMPNLVVVATGNLPAGGTRFALWQERQFKRTVGKLGDERIVYFRERDGSLEVAPIRDNLIIVTNGPVLSHLSQLLAEEKDSTGTPTGALDPYTRDRLRAVGEPDAPDALLVFVDPAELLVMRGVELPGFPIRRLALGVILPPPQTEGQIELRGELVGELLLSTPREAALFGRLSRLFVLGLVRGFGLDSSDLRSKLIVSVEDSSVAFRGIPVTVDELVHLLQQVARAP